MSRSASMRQPAWIGLSPDLSHCKTTQEAIIASGFDWTASVEPLYAEDHTKIRDRYQRVVRSSDGETLGVVRPSYAPYQPQRIFEVLEDIVGEGVVFETAGALSNGSKMYVTARLDRKIFIAGDELKPNIMAITSFDYSTPTHILNTIRRRICENAVPIACREATRIISIRHSANAEERLRDARKSLNLVAKYYDAYEVNANKLLSQAFTEHQFKRLVERLVPIKQDAGKRAMIMGEQTRENMLACRYASDIDHVKDTAWGAYNAIADYNDHHFPFRETMTASRAEKAFMKSFHDTGLKDQALMLIRAQA